MKYGKYGDGYAPRDELQLRERRACHIENMIRAEHGIDPREHYYPDTKKYPLLNKNKTEIIHGYDYSKPGFNPDYKTQPKFGSTEMKLPSPAKINLDTLKLRL